MLASLLEFLCYTVCTAQQSAWLLESVLWKLLCMCTVLYVTLCLSECKVKTALMVLLIGKVACVQSFYYCHCPMAAILLPPLSYGCHLLLSLPYGFHFTTTIVLWLPFSYGCDSHVLSKQDTGYHLDIYMYLTTTFL